MVWALSLSPADLITRGLTPVVNLCGIRSLIGVGKPCGAPNPFSALPPPDNCTRLVQKLFRGEPAITEFDWPFTPCHNSSKPFSTDPGSDFHVMLLTLPPGHGKITQLRVYRLQLHALFRLAFASAPRLRRLTLLQTITHRLIMQKARRQVRRPSDCL